MLTNTTIDAAIEKRFSEFSDAVKQELHTKLSSHEVITNYVAQFGNIRNMKNAFAEINKA